MDAAVHCNATRLVTFFDLDDRDNPLRNQVDRSTIMHGEIEELFEGTGGIIWSGYLMNRYTDTLDTED